jgi:hypothetical protein
MKFIFTFMIALLLVMGSSAQQAKYYKNQESDFFVPMRNQPQDSNIVVSFIPSIGLTSSYLAANIGLSVEAQFFRRFTIAPDAQIDLLGRYFAYGFHSTFFVATSRNSRIGFGYQGLTLDIRQEGSKFRDDDGIWLHKFYLDARIQQNERWDIRLLGGAGSGGANLEAGLVYRFIDK